MQPEYQDPWNAFQPNCLQIREELDAILAQCKQKTKASEKWREVFREISQDVAVEPLNLTEGVLALCVPSAAHSQEYSFRYAQQWVEGMNRSLGVGVIRRIRFVVR
jgi:hypothetical protein